MKFTCSVVILKPLKDTIAIWSNPDLLKEWQDGFLSLELIEGDAEQAGSKSRMLYKLGRGQMEIIETILLSDLPREMKGLYEHKSMTNTMHNKFKAISEHACQWSAEIHYTKFNGLMPKLMSKLIPGMFKKQTQKWMNQFSSFAEKYEQA